MTKPVSEPSRGKTGILLINLGTPDATSYWPMRRYLKEFLSDRRVVETNRVLWWLILNGIILSVRPKKSGRAYDKIWNRELDESPLRTFTRNQSQKLAERFSGNGDVIIEWAMRYGNPAISTGLDSLMNQGCTRVLVFPLYPQYASATTASIVDKVSDAMAKLRAQPTLRFVPPFYHDQRYINALAKRTSDHIKTLGWQPEKIIMSYHGLPQEYIDKGDPYYAQCLATTKSLQQAMDIADDTMVTTFQSRVGRKEWIKPYTDATIAELAQAGKKNVLVISPAFISDCLETLEELAIGLAEDFIKAGGENFSVAPCLNDTDLAIDMLKAIAEDELQGWI